MSTSTLLDTRNRTQRLLESHLQSVFVRSDRVFEMVRTVKGAKIAGADIVPATQLYTEDYMVKFLVQNSLGATWMGMHPESKLSEGWDYYVRDAYRAPGDTGRRDRAALTSGYGFTLISTPSNRIDQSTKATSRRPMEICNTSEAKLFRPV